MGECMYVYNNAMCTARMNVLDEDMKACENFS